jgi:uncharacterized membrane protein YvlD (DUF360 family)
VDSIKPTNATRTVAHIAVGVAAAVTVPKLTGKGIGAAIVSAIVVVFLHELLDAPVAKAMVSAGIQF